jgi:hypothetical protein
MDIKISIIVHSPEVSLRERKRKSSVGGFNLVWDMGRLDVSSSIHITEGSSAIV